MAPLVVATGRLVVNTFLLFSAAGLISYLLGAVPFGFLIARARGVDIRTVGSGNIGATNVFRCLGKKWGILTFVCDVLKGFIPAFVLPVLFAPPDAGDASALMPVICGFLAVAGHNWPVYLRFKGGKGVATTAGALLGIAPVPLALGIVCWIIVFTATRYVSVGSLAAALVIPASAWCLAFQHRFPALNHGPVVPAMLTVLGALVILRHRTNIRRLLNGTENRFEFGKGK